MQEVIQEKMRVNDKGIEEFWNQLQQVRKRQDD
jgi:hypothetical protein